MIRACIGRMAVIAALLGAAASAQTIQQTKGAFEDKFRQLGATELPTPNVYRTASGAPGAQYWQQRADYVIDVTLDEDAKRISGEARITYVNASPDTLRYLWVQLDQNRFRSNSLDLRSRTARKSDNGGDQLPLSTLRLHQQYADRDFGVEIDAVTTGRGDALDYTVVDTMMRVDLPEPLAPDRSFTFVVAWEHNIIEEVAHFARGGYEYFPDTDTYLYFMAQWFPRMAAYSDYDGWHNKSFLGRGEFALEFGDYNVAITVPADHIVSATGVLQNPGEVLTPEQRARLDEAETADAPVFIVTPEEAAANEAGRTSDVKTWRFAAQNVRDFAWCSSRKFIWDAWGYRQDDPAAEAPLVMAMSFYPNEAEPLWSKYSTHAVVHTMDVYSEFSFPYPYPTAQSVNTWEAGGMEYPMITFNGYRPTPYVDNPDTDADDDVKATYSYATKYNLIGVIIHEIGHIYFPMIVNSDERQWTWMDEGINSFLEHIAEQRWDKDFDLWIATDSVKTYMKSERQVPIMTQSDSVLQFGLNAYVKPASALVVLRETVMGREAFDFAFKEYARRWRFKRPTPADFFRTMEDASGVDLDWFWRGWFYSTDHVDVAITDVRAYQVSTHDPDVEFPLSRVAAEAAPHIHDLTAARNTERDLEIYVETNPGLVDLYNENDAFTVTEVDRAAYRDFLKGLEPWELEALETALEDERHYTFVDYENVGGLVMPLPTRLTLADGTTEDVAIPAEIWRRSPKAVTRMFITNQPVVRVTVAPNDDILDVDFDNNSFPRAAPRPSRIEAFKSSRRAGRDLMKDLLTPAPEGADDNGVEGGDAD